MSNKFPEKMQTVTVLMPKATTATSKSSNVVETKCLDRHKTWVQTLSEGAFFFLCICVSTSKS